MFYAVYVSRHQSPLKVTDVSDSQKKQEKKDVNIEETPVDPATVKLLSETNSSSPNKIAQLAEVSVISS